jgi:hypothetical protein
LSLCFLWSAALSTEAAEGRLLKVLPQLLDLKGRHTTSPSLYDRDAYQAYLRLNPTNISGIRFAVQWKGGSSDAPLKVRVEMEGIVQAKGPSTTKKVLEREVKPGGWFGRWTYIPLTGEDYAKFGSITAWRVTLWEGDRLLSEQKSFLW